MAIDHALNESCRVAAAVPSFTAGRQCVPCVCVWCIPVTRDQHQRVAPVVSPPCPRSPGQRSPDTRHRRHHDPPPPPPPPPRRHPPPRPRPPAARDPRAGAARRRRGPRQDLRRDQRRGPRRRGQLLLGRGCGPRHGVPRPLLLHDEGVRLAGPQRQVQC